MDNVKDYCIYDNLKDSKTDKNNMRFIIIKGSESAHCCFMFTVVDKKHGCDSRSHEWKRSMCETFEEQEAVDICVSLNRNFAEPNQQRG